jgi:hypothetical protein
MGSLISQHQDKGVESMMRKQGLVLLLGCGALLFLSVSKLWTVALVPLGFMIPMMLVSLRMNAVKRRFLQLQQESQETGRPLEELLARERGDATEE